MTWLRRQIVYTLFATLSAFLILELCAQGLQRLAPSFFVVAPQQAGLGPGMMLEPDPELIFRSRPGQRRIEGSQVQINAHGMRGEEIPRQDLEPRVLYLGDSSVFGWGVSRAEAFPWKVEQRLESEGLATTTLNAATPGYSSAQSRFQLQRLGQVLSPDVVVIASLWSDMMRTGWRDREIFERFGSAAHAAALRRQELLSHSSFFVLLRARLLSLRAVPADQYILWDTAIGGGQGGNLSRATVANHRANLEGIADAAEALGARPVFLILPANRLDEHPPEFILKPYQDNHREVAAARGAPCLDIDTRWRRHDEDTLAGLFMDRVHPSRSGHDDIAQALAPILAELLPQ